MKIYSQWQKIFLAALIVWTIVLNGLPVRAQDIVTGDDISGGSSVFVFRSSRKNAQLGSAFRSRNIRSSEAQRKNARGRIKTQAFASVYAKRKKAPPVNPSQIGASYKTPNKGKGKGSTKANKAINDAESLKLAGAAETFLAANDLTSAKEFFTGALDLNAENESARLGMSEVLSRQADEAFDKSSPNQTIKLYLEAVKYNANNSAAYAGLGEAYEAAGETDKAVANYEKAISITPELTAVYVPLSVLYIQQGKIAEADDKLTRAVQASPTDANAQFYYGIVKYKQGRNDEALTALQKADAPNSETSEAHYYLGAAMSGLKRTDEAIKEFNRAIILNESYTDAYFDRAVAQFNLGNYQAAADDYKKVIRLKNDYGQAYANLADVYRLMAMESKVAETRKANFELANSQYTLAAVYIKDDPELYSNWGFCLGAVYKWDVAAERLNTAVAIKPDAADYSNIGWAHHNSAMLDLTRNRSNISDAERAKNNQSAKAKMDKSRVALEQAVALQPRFFPALHNLGGVLLDLGDNQGAIRALSSAVQVRGDFIPTLVTLGVAYKQIKDYTNAVKYLKQATDLSKDKSVLGLYHLGESLYLSGDKKGAQKVQEKLKKLDPNRANELKVILSGATLINPALQNKNPLNKIPRLPY